jgi:hypothetical protein
MRGGMAKRLRPRDATSRSLGLHALATLAVVLATGRPADAREVTVPIVVDERFLTQQLLHTAYTDPGGTARVFDDGSGCNFLVLVDPKVTTEGGRLRVSTSGEARVGVAAGERCLLPVSWSGTIELLEEPTVDPHAPVVRFVVVDSTMLDADGEKPLASGTLWDWVKAYVHPRLETRIDLQGPIAELRSVLPAFGVATAGSTLDQALASLSLEGVEVREDGVAVRVRLDVPEPAPVASPVPVASPGSVPPLTEEELARWQLALQQWDAFLTFVVKVTGSDTKVAEVRRALLEILLEERYAMLDALANPDASVRDPVRPLFLRSWARLAPVLRRVSDALPADEALRYLSFVSAGDALQALEQLGPEYGIEVSADGLRRFARLVSPATLEDPLTYGVEIDPQLRELFGFGPPIAPPEENPDVEPTSWLPWVATAWAADAPDKALLKRLNSWAPTRADVAEYAPLARRLLEHVTEGLLARHEIAPAHQAVFRALVPATAWKESCWRQFVKRSGKLVPLTSKVGSIGIMQVNVSVWRGFYDVNGLRRDIGYNARAGGEILARYFTDYAVERKEDRKGGGVDALARAAYAAYNGGPGELSRYRRSGRSKRERAVDRDFFDKYRRTKAGEHLAVVECFTE